MKTQRIGLLVLTVFTAAAVACWAPNAAAGRPTIPPSTIETIWQLQAKGIAGSLGLAEKDAEALVEAYKAARKAYQEGAEKLPDGEDVDRQARREAMQKLRDESRGALEAKLKAMLKEEQVPQAMATLGSFDRNWDRYVWRITFFELDDEPLAQAVASINKYVIDVNKLTRPEADADRDAWREKRGDLKKSLDKELKKILNKEQYDQWLLHTRPHERERAA